MSSIFKKIYHLFDILIIVPISRLVFNIQNLFRKNGGFIDRLLNKPNFLILFSLVLAVIMFVLVDSKAISLEEKNAEVISNVPVNVEYNTEAFVVEGIPETVDITLTGRKSNIYLAKQLGEFEATLDLSSYAASDTPYKVYFKYSKAIPKLNYKLDPSYVTVTIKNKVSKVSSISYELINQDKLDSKLSVKKVDLSKNEIVVKGSESALDKIATIKALIDLSDPDLSEKGTYTLDNIELVAYDNSGKILNNIEMVKSSLSATVELDSYQTTLPIEVKTKGNLISGKSIASILVNNSADYSITVYGNESDLSGLTSIPVSIEVDNFGNENTKTIKTTVNKPKGVREMSTNTLDITLTFGNEQQKNLVISNISRKNLGASLNANIISTSDVTVISKGVSSVIDNIKPEDINAYVDLTGLGVGEHEVEVKIDNNNPLVTYVVESKITVRISAE